MNGEGTVIARRYRLDERLGEGGMGVVWRAVRMADDEAVAVKVLKESGRTASVSRFVREARAAAAVQHPNVIAVHDVVEADERTAIVMDLLEGETLAQRVAREGPLEDHEVATVLMQVAAGVGAAHAHGIVHRDLKPSNVFLASGGVKVLDFGIAKWLEPGATDATTTSGALLGTPCYMSPEQAFGERDLDHRTDLWALGIIAYECLSGTLPTRAENIGQVLKIVLHGRIKPLAELAPNVAPGLATLVDRLLRLERDDRPGDMREVIAALEPFTDQRVAAVDPPRVRARRSRDTPLAGLATLDHASRSERRGTFRWLAAAVLLSGLLGISAYAMRARTAEPPSRPPAVDERAAATPAHTASPATAATAEVTTKPTAQAAVSAPAALPPTPAPRPKPRDDTWPTEFAP